MRSRRGRGNSAALGRELIALVGIAWITGPAVASGQDAEPWPIKEFQVVAVEPSGVSETGHLLDTYVEELVRSIRSEGYFDPDFPTIFQTVALDAATKTEMESVLRTAASKLESWGFSAPVLEPVVEDENGADAYRVYLVTGRDFAGAYHPRPCAHGSREAVIVLDAESVLDSSGSLSNRGVQTLAHELFHAVQAATPAYRCGDGNPGNWITEGTARAIGWDIAREIRGYSTFRDRWAEAWGARVYSERLPIPPRTGGAYRTSSFWRFLAEYSRSRPTFPGPGPSWPSGYGFLSRLLDGGLNPPDCQTEGDPCDAELRWLAAGLGAQFGLSLRELYARFIQAYALYGEGRVHSTEDGSPKNRQVIWLGRSFAHENGTGCARIVLGPGPDDTDQDHAAGRLEDLQRVDTVAHFPEVAARCWEIELDGFAEAVTLAVTVSYRPGAEVLLEQLTAVMADRSGRVDEAEVRTVADVPEASWYYGHLGIADPALFLLTNVADSPDATRGLANLSVTFTALREYAFMGTGGSGGDGSGGPTPADVARPLPIELDSFRSHLIPGPLDLHREVGFQDACMLRFTMSNSETGDAIFLQMDHEGPITPGDFPVLDVESYRGEFRPEDHPNQFDVSFEIGEGNPLSQGDGQSYRSRGGTVTIESISPELVQGRVRLTGERAVHGEWEEDGWREYPPELRDLSVEAVFNLQPRLSAGAGQRLGKTVAECVAGNRPDPRPRDPAPHPKPRDPKPPKKQEEPKAERAWVDEPGVEGILPGEEPDDVADPPPGGAEPVPAAGDAPNAEREQVLSYVNSLSLRASGAVDTTLTIRGEDLTLTGGCTGSSPISLGFRKGRPDGDDYLNLSFDTREVVAPGQTGAFALEEVTWDDGTSVISLPAGTEIRAPNRLTGPGSITLAVHRTEVDDRRIAGTVRADVEGDEGRSVELVAEFSVNLACGSR